MRFEGEHMVKTDALDKPVALSMTRRLTALFLIWLVGMFLMPVVSNGQRLPEDIIDRMNEAATLVEATPDSAMAVSWQIWEDVEETKDIYLMAVVRGFLGYQGSKVGDIEMGYINFRSALELLQRADTLDYYNLVAVLENLGIIHSDFNDNERAIEYFREATQYSELYLAEYPNSNERDEFKGYRDSDLFAIAIEMSKNGDLEEAEKILLELLKTYQKGGEYLTRGSILNELALIQSELKNFEKSKEYFLRIIDDDDKEIDEADKGIAFHNLAGVFLALKEFDKAEEYFLLALDNPSKRGDSLSVFLTYVDLGELYFEKRDLPGAVRVWELALETFPDPSGYELYNVYDWLRKGYEELGQRELAKSYEALYVKYKEGYEKSLAVIRANEDRDEFLNLVERLRNEELEKELKQDYTLMIILIAGMAVMLTCLILIRRKKIRQKKLYEKLGSILKGD